MRFNRSGVLALVLLLVLASAPAQAHKPSDSYLRLNFESGQALTGRWDIALRDLEYAIGLDSNADGAITWGELKAQRGALFAYALARLGITAGGEPCASIPGALKTTEHTDGGYAVLYFAVECNAPVDRFTVDYRLFTDLDPSHRGLLQVRGDGLANTAVLGPDRPQIEITSGQTNRWRAFSDYLRQGIHHIWIGIDHILFLVVLLLPAVLIWRDRRWRPQSQAGAAIRVVVAMVTAFTVAHSITLSLAVLGVVSLPSRLVESVIALSIVVMALNNIYPVMPRGRWVLAFIFGLAHGFGFASVLADLGLPGGALGLALFGFNVGVEIGQLVIVIALLPMSIALRHTAFYRVVVLYGGSVVVAALASLWLYQRAFGV